MASKSDAPFEPIVLPGLSQASGDVALRIARVPTLTERTARLGAPPPDALKAAVAAEPDIYHATITEATETATCWRLLADSFAALSDRLASIKGERLP
jgi:hypothetical protein